MNSGSMKLQYEAAGLGAACAGQSSGGSPWGSGSGKDAQDLVKIVVGLALQAFVAALLEYEKAVTI